MLRIFLFLATNIAVLVVVAIVFSLLGLDRAVAADGGLDLAALLVMSAVIGFAGSLISLFLSKWMAKRSMNVRLVDGSEGEVERWLVETVRAQAKKAGIGMPEVGVFPSPQPNAFATGWNRNAALVAVSEGLVRGMDREEVEAVLGHEVSHVANGDMVTLALIQGVVNTFVIFLSRIIGMIVDRAVFRSQGTGPGFWITSILAQIVLGFLASAIVMWFSRRREFRADAGGADLAGRRAMIGALERLQAAKPGRREEMPQEMRAFAISAGKVSKLFASHPPLEVRIAALRAEEARAPSALDLGRRR